MTTERTNMPRSIKGYNTFITVTTPYLSTGSPLKYIQFGWTAAQLAFWQGLLTAWNLLYPSYINKKGGYTTDIKNDLMNIIKNTIAYDKTNKLIMKVKATANLTSLDCTNFNIPETYSAPVTGMHPVVAVKGLDKTIITLEGVYPKLLPELNGMVHIKAYAEKAQSGRPHKLKGFDLLEYSFGVFYLGAANLPTLATDTRMTLGYSSKSNFVLATVTSTTNLTALAAGALTPVKIIVILFRWAKSKHPTLDGPWNGPFTSPLM
jgi:hypothetical protein